MRASKILFAFRRGRTSISVYWEQYTWGSPNPCTCRTLQYHERMTPLAHSLELKGTELRYQKKKTISCQRLESPN